MMTRFWENNLHFDLHWIYLLDHKLQPEDGSSTFSEMLVSGHEITRRNNSENCDFFYVSVYVNCK